MHLGCSAIRSLPPSQTVPEDKACFSVQIHPVRLHIFLSRTIANQRRTPITFSGPRISEQLSGPSAFFEVYEFMRLTCPSNVFCARSVYIINNM
jgi:hypothetical protein